MENFTFISACDDNRIADLQNLVKSIKFFYRDAKIAIIPFSDNVLNTRAYCDSEGLTLCERNDRWDDIGKSIYGDFMYRPTTPGWLYFRKLNFLNQGFGNRLFLDANAILTRHQTEIFAALEKDFDVVFNSRAGKNRNYQEPLSKALALCKDINPHGYNLGYCAIHEEGATLLANMISYFGPRIRPLLRMSPEQSVLSLALTLSPLRVALPAHIDQSLADTNNSNNAIAISGDEVVFAEGRFEDKIALSLKKTGNPKLEYASYDKFLKHIE